MPLHGPATPSPEPECDLSAPAQQQREEEPESSPADLARERRIQIIFYIAVAIASISCPLHFRRRYQTPPPTREQLEARMEELKPLLPLAFFNGLFMFIITLWPLQRLRWDCGFTILGSPRLEHVENVIAQCIMIAMSVLVARFWLDNAARWLDVTCEYTVGMARLVTMPENS